ncbi:MAG: CoB--CoM heterodisulfide reductase iron-sulfur subunit B family protein [Candidatus Bathyarchaeota archaeon]|nr:CoB--CoM heterodisulfide reductase iron-sulfur subunit B family protein [Candidatus Bathyarchaeota archaeon]
MRYSFFKGCFIPIRQPHIEKLAHKILPELGVELDTVTGFTCCPEPMGVSLPHKFTGTVISARNLAIAEEKDNDIITLCNGCTYTLKQVNLQLKQDTELRDKVNEVLAETDHQFKGTIKVRHFAKVLSEDIGLEIIRGKVEKPLKGLKVASHTGCHILSPPEVMEFDDPLNPVRLDGMIKALGAEPLDYSYKTQCCGWTLSNFGDRASANRLLGDKLRGMYDAGADSVNVICPQCLAQLDTGQMMAGRALKLDFKLPALFYVQYLALAMGYSLEEVGYGSHRVKDSGFEAKIGGILA